jgi:hypothetical protein
MPKAANSVGVSEAWGPDGWEDKHVRELKKRLIPLTMDNFLVAPNYLKELIHHI